MYIHKVFIMAVSAPTPKKTPPAPNKGQGPNAAAKNSKNQNTKNSSPANRKDGESLAGAVTQGLDKAAGTVASLGGEFMKESMKGGLSKTIFMAMQPVRRTLGSNPITEAAFMQFVKMLAPKLDEYLAANKIQLPMESSALIEKLFFGRQYDLDGEVSKVLDGFIEKALPQDLQQALTEGNLSKIAMASSSSLTTGVKGLVSQVLNFNPKGNKFANIFRFAGAKLPLVNRLSKRFQPWAAGGLIFMFGGAVINLFIRFTKLVLNGALLAGALALGKKFLDWTSKKKPPGAGGGLPGMMGGGGAGGGLMNALGSVAQMAGGAKPGGMGMPGLGGLGGAPGAGPAGGIGNMMNAASGIMSMLGKK